MTKEKEGKILHGKIKTFSKSYNPSENKGPQN